MKITELFKKIETTASNTEKIQIMTAGVNDTIITIYNDCYDKQRNYGVKKFNLPDVSGRYTLDKDYDKFHDMLETLNSRSITGDAAVDLVETTIGMFTSDSQQILQSIMNRKLTIGLSKVSFDKIIGDKATKTFEVTLAFDMNKVKGVNPIDGTYFASRKLDGCRCVAFVNVKDKSVDVDFISRQGKQFTTLDNVKPALRKLMASLPKDRYVLDGECCIVDKNGDEHFDWIMKEIRRKDHTIKHPCYQVFDFVTMDEFLMKRESKKFEERYTEIVKLFKGFKEPEVKFLKQERIRSQEDFDRWNKYVEDGDWEGFMLRKDVPFEVGRTKNLLKVKKFVDAEFVVKDIEIDTMTTSIPGQGNIKYDGVKSLVIEYAGNIVNVGSGLSREQRIDWYKDPKKIIGKTVCVKYFEVTENKNGTKSLRFPILKYVYENGRDC